jgi:hypothetical protein
VIAAEIAENLEAALEQFAEIHEDSKDFHHGMSSHRA